MAAPEKVKGRVIDAHSHIGEMEAWAFYNLKEPVKPTVYEFADANAYLRRLDDAGVERGLILPNYGIPVQSQPFSLNDLVLESIKSSDRLVGGIWVSLFAWQYRASPVLPIGDPYLPEALSSHGAH